MDSSNIKLVVGSLIALGVVVGIGILLAGGGNSNTSNATTPIIEADFSIPKVDEKDHIIGNTNADVILVEYSDTECPFCKEYHSTMNSVVSGYQPTEFAWVYRHLPLTQIHPKAVREAVATECAATLGGENTFWQYINRLYEITPSNNNLNLNRLPEIAEEIGLNKEAFNQCLESNDEAQSKVTQQAKDAFDSGATGTPYNIIIVRSPLSENKIVTLNTMLSGLGNGSVRMSADRTMLAFSGGLPEQYVRNFIDTLRSPDIEDITTTQAATSTQ